jgi:hypothetical protein
MVSVHAEPKGEDWRCEVDVDLADQRTRHAVTVKRADLERWGDGLDRVSVEALVARSFDFLLDHEPPDAILPSFDLSVIESYFPEFGIAIERHRP